MKPFESENLTIARRYLEAIERGEPGDSLAFFAEDAVQEEFPNRLTPRERGGTWRRSGRWASAVAR